MIRILISHRCFGGLFVLLASIFSCVGQSAERPNILMIMADDCTFRDLSIYGGTNAKTPNLDRLASQGLVFDNAYVSSAMCQPCRAELYTGQFPIRNGCAWNHSACRPGTKSLPHYMTPQGYRTGIAGKVHVKPDSSFPFEAVPGFDASAVRSPTNAHDISGIREFMTRNAKQPFCLVVALVEPHVPWVMGDSTQYPVEKIKLPPNLAQTPKTKQDFAAYLAEITYMDGQVGEILELLESSGLSDDTLVIFTSEQGSQFPGNKWTCWDVGLHTALIFRWPGRIAANQRTSAIVHYADVVPTLVEVSGGNVESIDATLDGKSFASVLDNPSASHRNFSFATHNNFPEGPPYPIRSISDGNWRYIRNLTPDEVYIEKHLMGLLGGATIHNPYWSSWMATASENPKTYQLVKRYMHRPAEELYHTAEDPYEMNDLAGDKSFVEIKAKLSAELDRWLSEQKDTGVAVDNRDAHRAATQGEHTIGQ